MTCTAISTQPITGDRGPGDRPLGLAKLSSLIQQERVEDPHLLLVDNGDLLQGTPFMYHYAKFGGQVMHPAARALNALSYDAAVPGNHEFNYGLELLGRTMRDSDCPWLCANIWNEADGTPAFGSPYRVFELPQGIRIAVLGVTTHYIPNWEEPAHIRGVRFEDVWEAARRWVAHIRETERPDAVVVSYHGGFERDPATGEPTEPLTGENQGYAICADIPGIDVLLTGHQHRLLVGEVNGVVMTQPGCAGQALAKVRLSFERTDTGAWALRNKTACLLQVDDTVPADEALLSMFEEEERRTQQWLNQPIGEAEGDLSISDPFAGRQSDHAFTEFINRVQMAVTGAELSCAAIFTDEARGFTGPITMRDVVSNYIYPNTLKVVRLSGADIRAALEQSACYFEVDPADGSLRVSAAFLNPKPQHFNYDMWEGIEYELDISRPAGSRVTKLTRGGATLDPQAQFEVAMNSYRASGGGNFAMLTGKPVVREIPTDMTEILADWIMNRGIVRAACDSNWCVVY